ncbi:aminoglycoside phosphotransferase family protein [Yoonia sp. R2-816]|uniref:aminoglycoside phosphotransferase family protein n=1 Tax=Yoonia sp. R2-816 TaxID=3342638 RepID=UPI00372BBDC1
MRAPPDAILRRFGVTAPVLVAETKIAIVWKVDFGKEPAALKIYKNGDMQDERPGFDLLKALDGRGAAKVHAVDDGAALMEWLDGPTLGDLSRAGRDDDANAMLARVAGEIHGAGIDLPLTPLTDRFAALRNLTLPSHWPDAVRRNLHRGQQIAAAMLTAQQDIRPLHGDLHHDNIKQGSRGWVSFDAKGVLGDPAYDLANAFKNPIDSPEITMNPARIKRLATTLGHILNIAPQRLLGWAVAHCALSMAWTDDPSTDPNHRLLDMLLTLYTDL